MKVRNNYNTKNSEKKHQREGPEVGDAAEHDNTTEHCGNRGQNSTDNPKKWATLHPWKPMKRALNHERSNQMKDVEPA